MYVAGILPFSPVGRCATSQSPFSLATAVTNMMSFAWSDNSCALSASYSIIFIFVSFIRPFIDWLIDWFFDWLIYWVIRWLIDWLIDFSIDLLIDWLIYKQLIVIMVANVHNRRARELSVIPVAGMNMTGAGCSLDWFWESTCPKSRLIFVYKIQKEYSDLSTNSNKMQKDKKE